MYTIKRRIYDLKKTLARNKLSQKKLKKADLVIVSKISNLKAMLEKQERESAERKKEWIAKVFQTMQKKGLTKSTAANFLGIKRQNFDRMETFTIKRLMRLVAQLEKYK